MANIKKHLDNIKGALFGKEVRSSIHDGIDAINKEVESTTNRQEHLEGTFDQLIINSGNSNAEIVDARVGENGKSYAKLGDRLDEVDSQLEHKANKSDLNLASSNISILENNKADKTHIWSMSNMGQDIKEAMTGGSVAVVGKDMVLEENIVDYQITKRKTSFYIKTINLSCKSLEIIGKGINSNTGNIYDNDNLVATEEYIYINTQYISAEKFENELSVGTNEEILIAFYDENKTFISSATLKINNFVEVPSGACYIRYQLMIANLYGFNLNLLPCKELQGGYIKEYEFEEMDEINKNFEKLKNGNSFKDGAITPDKLSFFNVYKNLFDSSTVQIGAILKVNGNLSTDFTDWRASDWIKVKANTTIFFSNDGEPYVTHLGALYNTSKQYLSPINDVTQIDVIEDGYMRVSQNGGFPSKYQIEVGEVTEYKEFDNPKALISSEYLKIEIPNNYENKKYLLLGDSITRLDTTDNGWVKYFNNIMNPEKVVNISVNGCTWKDYSDTPDYDGNPTPENHLNVIGNQVQKVINQKTSNNADYEDFDVIIIACGTNDSYDTNNPETDESIEAEFVTAYGKNDFAVKTIDSVDRKTFAGIMRYTYEKLYELYPNAVFFVTTPLQEVYESYKVIKAKGDLIDAVADRLSINTINARRCGILNIYESPVNDIDYDNPTGSDSSRKRDLSDGIHTNASGAKKLGEFIARDIINYFNF